MHKSAGSSPGIKNLLFLISAALATFFVISSAGQATIPHLINLQGRLINSTTNRYLSGTYNFSFYIYDAASGGSKLWSETQSTVSVNDGLFDVILGNSNSIGLDFTVDYWLAMEVQSDGEMSPRQRIASTGYAYLAEDLVCTDCVDFSDLAQNYTNNTVYFGGHLPSHYSGGGGSGSYPGDVFVNETGDSMTGDLNISASAGIYSGHGYVNITPANTEHMIHLLKTGANDSALRFHVDYFEAGASGSDGANSPSSTAQYDSNTSWSNADNIKSNDASDASVTLGAYASSRYLVGKGFGFDIPSGATVTGVKVEVESSLTTSTHKLNLVWNGHIIGTTNTSYCISGGYYFFGHDTDTWGFTLNESVVESSTFGAGYKATAMMTGGSATADHMRITVYYTSDVDIDENWTVGMDYSDSRKFKVSNSNALGTNDYLTINTGGSFELNGPVNIYAGSGYVNVSSAGDIDMGGNLTIRGDGSGAVTLGVSGYRILTLQGMKIDTNDNQNPAFTVGDDLYIDASGDHVGIGDTSPDSMLNVHGDTKIYSGHGYINITPANTEHMIHLLKTGANDSALRFHIDYFEAGASGSDGANSPSSTAQYGSNTEWTDPENIKANDASDASISFGGAGSSDYLVGKGFGFDIPSGATVTGVKVEVESSLTLLTHSVKLVWNGHVVGSSNSTVYQSGSYYFWEEAGGSSTWGFTLNESVVESSTFGAGYMVTSMIGGSSATADHMRITVYYTSDVDIDENWTVGMDYSDSRKFKVSNSNALGTNDYLTINTTGDVGIGDTSPASLLTVHGNTTTYSGSGYVNITASSGNQNMTGILAITPPSGQSQITMIDNAGNNRCMVCWTDGVCNSTLGAC